MTIRAVLFDLFDTLAYIRLTGARAQGNAPVTTLPELLAWLAAREPRNRAR